MCLHSRPLYLHDTDSALAVASLDGALYRGSDPPARGPLARPGESHAVALAWRGILCPKCVGLSVAHAPAVGRGGPRDGQCRPVFVTVMHASRGTDSCPLPAAVEPRCPRLRGLKSMDGLENDSKRWITRLVRR